MLIKFDNETEWLEARKKDVTSTEVASLFGLNPYKSRLRLWHEKAGNVEPEFEETPFTIWGRRLQVPVAMGICEDNGWQGLDLSRYYARHDTLALGASFDVKAITAPDEALMLEVKVAESFREADGWFDSAAPMQYEIQLQTQMHLAIKEDPTIKRGAIGVLGKRQCTRLYIRDYNASFGTMIEQEVFKFWQSIHENNPPAPDYAIDGDLLESIRKPIRQGDVINLSADQRAIKLVEAYRAYDDALTDYNQKTKPLRDCMREVKAELMSLIGRNETAIVGDFIISTKEQKREDTVVYGSSFRRFDLKKRKK